MAYQGKVVSLDLSRMSRSDEPTAIGLAGGSGACALDHKTLRSVDPLLQYGTAILPFDILNAWDWWPSLGVHRLVAVFEDGTIRKDTFGAATFATTLHNYGGSINSGHKPNFVEGGKEAAANNRKLFIFVQDQQVRVLSGDGATATALATPPADWATAPPTCGAIHEGRLWASGSKVGDTHRVYYSTTGNHEDFTGAGSGSLSIFPGEGEKITSIMSYRGYLLVWKYPVGIYYIDTTDPTVTNWKIKRLTADAGGVSPTGMCTVENDIVFMNYRGQLFTLSPTQDFGSLSLTNLTDKMGIQNSTLQFFPFFAPANTGAVKLIYFAPRKEIHVVQSQGPIWWVIDLNGEIPRRVEGVNIGVGNIWNALMDDLTPVYGTCDAIRIYHGGLLAAAGVAGTYMRPPDVFFSYSVGDFSQFDPSFALKRKSGHTLEIVPHFFFGLDQVFTVKIYWDNVLTQTKTFTVPFVINSSADKYIPMRLVGGGRNLVITIEAVFSDPNRYIEIKALNLRFSVNDERDI